MSFGTIMWNQTFKKGQLCYIDAYSFITFIKTDDIYVDISKDVERRFNTSNYELKRPLHKGKIKKSQGLMKDDKTKNNGRVCRIKSKNA